MDRAAWRATVCGIPKSWTRLSIIDKQLVLIATGFSVLAEVPNK